MSSMSARVVSTSDEGQARALAWKRWAPLLLIWLVASLLRALLSQGDRVVWGDEPFYLWLGRNWVSGKGYSFIGHADVHHGPLFPWLAGLLYLLTRDLALSSEILYVALGSLLVVPVYAIGNELYDRRTGLGAAGLAAVFPALTAGILHWGTMTEATYMLLVYIGLWAGTVILRPVWRSDENAPGERRAIDPWWAYGLAGLAFGLAYLTRPEAIGYFAIVGLLFLGLRALVRGPASPSGARFLCRLAIYVAAFGIVLVPYMYYVQLTTGSWMISEKAGVTYVTCLGLVRGDTAAFDRATWGLDSTGLETFFFSPESYDVSMVKLILDDPRAFAGVLYMNALRFARILIDWALLPYVLLPFVFLGLFKRGWTRERMLGELFLFSSTVPVLGFVLFLVQARYLVPMIPVLILWAARGLVDLSDWLIGTVIALRTPEGSSDGLEGRSYWHMPRPWRSFFELGPVLLVMAGLIVAQPAVVRQVTNVGSVRPEHKAVGEHLAPLLPRQAVIMSRYPAIAFHADTNWVPTPNASWAEILPYARHKGVDYFIIDERELRYRPQLVHLVTGGPIPEQLELVYESAAGGERLTVYRFVG